jgi:opacity protein-like surface antigen
MLAAPRLANAAHGYVGLGFGNSRATVDNGSVSFNTVDWNPDVTIWRLFADYQVNDYVGVEGGYIPLGKARVSTMDGAYFESNVTGLELTPIASFPIFSSFSVFARGGLIFWHSNIKYDFHMDSGEKKKSGSSLALSLGFKYDLTKQFGVRAEYSRYNIDKSKAGAGDQRVVVISGTFAF